MSVLVREDHRYLLIQAGLRKYLPLDARTIPSHANQSFRYELLCRAVVLDLFLDEGMSKGLNVVRFKTGSFEHIIQAGVIPGSMFALRSTRLPLEPHEVGPGGALEVEISNSFDHAVTVSPVLYIEERP